MDFHARPNLFRVVVLGESSVGKTSIINQLVHNEINPMEQSTIGASFIIFEEVIDGNRIGMQIWDTAGQEKYRSLSPIYCRGAAAAIITYDITSIASFSKLEQWANLVGDVSGTDTVIFVAGNKCDLTASAEVSDEEVNAWAEARGFPVVKTSAKTGQGVSELFHAIAIELNKKGCFSHKTHKILRDSKSSSCC